MLSYSVWENRRGEAETGGARRSHRLTGETDAGQWRGSEKKKKMEEEVVKAPEWQGPVPAELAVIISAGK